MNPQIHILVAAIAAVTLTVSAADELPKTLLATRGKLLYSEDFSKSLPPVTGKPVGCASGFTGWRYNTGGIKGGNWQQIDGTFKGVEHPDAHHPATASYGIQFKDAIIQCDVRLDDAPAKGRLYRSFFVKATDAKDYVCALMGSQGGFSLVPYDDARINPTTKQRDKNPAIAVKAPMKLGEWHTAVLEIKGDEVVGTMDGKSATFSNPLISTGKHSIMLGVGTEASFRNLKVWEALPNADWPKNKQSIANAEKPAGK